MLFYEEKWEKGFLSQIGGRLRRGAKPVRLAAEALLLRVRVVAGCAPCRVTPLTLGVTLQRSAAPPFPSGPCAPPGTPYQNTLGAVPQDPLTLKLRLDTNWTFQQMLKSRFVRRRRYALKVPAAHFYVEIVDRVPLPRSGGGVGGAEPSAASGGCSEAEHP